ncbi:MAG: DUF3445 domain-containing protein, partial [Halioglobus sp.]|nr:DUF3445 domain-containing protein [Halioglobus sp.]
CYQALPQAADAAGELAGTLRTHLLHEQPGVFEDTASGLLFTPHQLALPVTGAEPLWNCSLWVADDLLLLQEVEGCYRLTAASLCSPGDWRLEDKIGQPLGAIHQPVPGFERTLLPGVERFFRHLRSEHPVLRWNWSLQAGDALNARGPRSQHVAAETPLFYRCERQCLKRLPVTGAVVFSIRIYLHPLEALQRVAGAMPALFEAIATTPPALASYKGFDRLALALRKYAPEYTR